MKLELDPMDLKPEFQTGKGYSVDQKISARDIKFDMFKDDIQAAIIAVGGATFYAWDKQTYNAIAPPH